MSNQTLPEKPKASPAQQYRDMVEKSVTREIQVMLEHNPAALAKAKARIAIAFRDASQANPKLLECSPASVVRAVMMSVVTGLSPGGVNPTCYLTSRWNSKAKCNEVQWQASHRGLIQLANRSGYGVRAEAVYDADDFDLDLSAIRTPSHRPGPEPRDWSTLVGCYVIVYSMETGVQVGWTWISRSDIEARRSNSDAWQRGQKEGAADWERSSPWYKWPVEMALKTAIRYAAARGLVPSDDALGHALAADADDAIQAPAEVEQPRQIAQRDPLSVLDQEREVEMVDAEESPAK